jgi:hypothetical protein
VGALDFFIAVSLGIASDEDSSKSRLRSCARWYSLRVWNPPTGCPFVAEISPVSRSCFKRRRSAAISASGSLPKSFAMAAPIDPAGAYTEAQVAESFLDLAVDEL